MRRILSVVVLALLVLGCSDAQQHNKEAKQLLQLQTELDSLKNIRSTSETAIQGQIASFLTFQKGDAEAAMNFYISLFDNAEIIQVKRWGKGSPGKEGTIMHASFRLNGKLFMCSDSPAIHEWGFTPAVSNFVQCTDEAMLKALYQKLSENGKVMMPLGDYGFSKQFGFVEDRFGVSWQLNLD